MPVAPYRSERYRRWNRERMRRARRENAARGYPRCPSCLCDMGLLRRLAEEREVVVGRECPGCAMYQVGRIRLW